MTTAPTQPKADSDARVYARVPVASDFPGPPVVVVGVPRSGSKFLTHVLNQVEDLYVFDDLYLRREADGVGGGSGPLDDHQLSELIGWLSRRTFIKPDYPYAFERPNFTQHEADALRDAVLAALRGRGRTWVGVLQEWMVRVALRHGRTRWGYKAPGDFFCMDQIDAELPDTRYLYLHRDPRTMLASRKFSPDLYGGRGLYHPWVYASYWRLAHRMITGSRASREGRVMRVAFEDMVKRPNETAEAVAAFVGSRVTGPVPVGKVNSSFKANARRAITPTERWLCGRVAGREMLDAGYDPDGSCLRLRDVPDLIATSCRFSAHQARRAVVSPRSRAAVRRMVSGLCSHRPSAPTTAAAP